MAATLWSSSSSSSSINGSSVFVFTTISHSRFHGLRLSCSTRIHLVLPKHKSFGSLNDSTNKKCNNNWHMTTFLCQESRQRRQQHLRSSLSRKEARHSDAAINEEENVSRATLIWRAVKLPIYSVALVPLTVGSAAAYLQAGIFSAARYFLLLASSTLVILWLNLSNDVYDFDTGADKNKKESIVNIAGTRTGILIAAYFSLSLGFCGLTWASLQSANIRAILLLASAITCGYIYQCPPCRLSYQGLGEPLCFAAFGPFATTAFYLLQSKTSELLPISGNILSASVLVGLTTSLILFCSHFHQVNGDKSVGKYSPMVRLGTEAGAEVVKVSVITLYVILIVLGFTKYLPSACTILCGLTIPMGRKVINYVKKYHEDKAKIFMAKYYCVRLHTLFGIALAAGLVVARLFATKSNIKTHVILT